MYTMEVQEVINKFVTCEKMYEKIRLVDPIIKKRTILWMNLLLNAMIVGGKARFVMIAFQFVHSMRMGH